jgi:ribosomal protein S18 acetylase RimI-like enzyme
MPEIDVRPGNMKDVESLNTFEHGYYSEYVWQMAMDFDAQGMQTGFRRVRLPRRVFVAYPRKRERIFSDLEETEAFLLAELDNRAVGYIKVYAEPDSQVLRVSDLVISAPMRRHGIASGLLLALMNLASSRDFINIVLEMQSKNDPAVCMATKMGFNYCGFRDNYFPNQELALFYSRYVR